MKVFSLDRQLGFEQLNRQPQLLVSLGLLYGIFLLATALSPFEFELSLNAIREKLLGESNFVPFLAHFSGRSIYAAIDIIREVVLYAPLGAIIAFTIRVCVSQITQAQLLIIAGLVGGLYALSLELMQLIVVGRYVDITDGLLAALGCVGGVLLLPLFVADKRR